MITIVEPKEYIAKLWGEQSFKEGEIYRLMKYVLRVNHDGKVLLHNVVTGQLVVLEKEETQLLDNISCVYNPKLEQLVTSRFLVPVGYDEHNQVVKLRSVLRKIDSGNHSRNITNFVILPTTACNAHCYYCYQYNIPTENMSEQTAEQVAEFVWRNCGEKKHVTLTWFGGEPTLLTSRIDQICEALRVKNIVFRSFMISNGYLLSEKVIERAKELWNLRHVSITIDGTEKTYNQIKAYTNPSYNPYIRVMENIKLLLNNGIAVKIRMNYDKGNWNEFYDLVEEIKQRFTNRQLLEVSAHRILGDYPSYNENNFHGDERWYAEKKVELDEIVRSAGLTRKSPLPYLRYEPCGAAKDSTAVITPDGSLVSCPDQLGKDQIIGNVREGVTNLALVEQWKQFTEYQKCSECPFMPYCVHILCCNAKDNCASRESFNAWVTLDVQDAYDAWGD